MTIHSFPAKGTTKEESPLSEPSSKQTNTLSNYLTGQLPAIELPLYLPPRLVTVASTSTPEILKEYFGGERPSTPTQDASDPRVVSRTNSSAVSSTQACAPTDEQVFFWYHKSATQGHAGAQFYLGWMYVQGQGVKQDYAQAVDWYREAAEQGHADAQFNLGWMYEQGLGVKQDDAQAVNWYREAAEQGHADAQFNLGLMYEQGQGVKQDDAQAFFWYRLAADKGNSAAQYNLGLMYADDTGVAANDTQALDWFRKAAEQDNADAQFQIGYMYAKGKGVEVDDVKAFNWYLKAAEQGDAEAQLNLASVYHQGLGVKKDVLQATYWLLRWAVEGTNGEIFLSYHWVTRDCYSDVIQYIPAALAKFPEFDHIKTINFQRIELSDQDFLSIGQMIRANTHLEGLNLKNQIITNTDAQILSQSLAFNTTLTELIFDDEYDFDATIFDGIKASLAQNVIIAELREHMKNHPMTRSDELPFEVLDIIVDNMIVAASKAGKSKEAKIAAIDEFLLSASQKTLKNDLKKI